MAIAAITETVLVVNYVTQMAIVQMRVFQYGIVRQGLRVTQLLVLKSGDMETLLKTTFNHLVK